jgi:hypothetical protein
MDQFVCYPGLNREDTVTLLINVVQRHEAALEKCESVVRQYTYDYIKTHGSSCRTCGKTITDKVYSQCGNFHLPIKEEPHEWVIFCSNDCGDRWADAT